MKHIALSVANSSARMQNYEEDRPIAARREQFWLEYFGIEGVQ